MDGATNFRRGVIPVLAVDDEPAFLDLYRAALKGSDNPLPAPATFALRTCRNGKEALSAATRARDETTGLAVVFLDLNLEREMDGVAVGEGIRRIDAHANIVIVTGLPADRAREVVERIPPLDKLLYLQKPLHLHEIRQLATALGAKWHSETLLRQTARTLEEKIAALEISRRELLDKTGELEQVNTQLMETNDALAVLARNIESTRKESERRMLQKTRTYIIPSIERLQRIAALAPYRDELDLLMNAVENLTAEVTEADHRRARLSTTETRIAALIRNGMSSHEIARHLCISLSTVKTHRKNIRRKLELVGSGMNLASYLEGGRG